MLIDYNYVEAKQINTPRAGVRVLDCFFSFFFSTKEAFPYLQTKTHTDPKDPKSQRVSVFWSKRRGGGGGGNKRKRQGSDSKGSNVAG